jgi:homeobox protein cut-like
MEAIGLMNEEMVQQWRQSLQRSPLGGLGLPVSPYHPLSTPTPAANCRSSSESRTPQPSSPPPASAPERAPHSTPKFSGEASPERAGTPSNGHSSPTPDRPDSASNCTPSAANGGSNAQSDLDEAGSPVRVDSKSPFKSDERPSPSLPINFPGAPPGLNLQFPLHMSVSPLVSSGRIPKSDPMEGRLQDMLRYNMEKYAGQALDTLGTSRRVRELLSIHNIGQRLFAKYVLGLSQGTVSELLSKPKCWEKLTEKGRDSYRKMHAWAYDENAVMLLKSLIPRKGELMRPMTANPLLMAKGSFDIFSLQQYLVVC